MGSAQWKKATCMDGSRSGAEDGVSDHENGFICGRQQGVSRDL